jgi:redox-sensitive bicupin YhaK (pirin superfamily)
MGQPRYQEVSAATIPTVEKDGAKVRIVAGTFAEVAGPVTQIAAQPLYMDVTLAPGAVFDLPVPQGHALRLYVFEGAGLFGDGELIESVKMLVMGDGDSLTVRAGDDSGVRFMVMAGAPFKEPIFPYGPFVMNTEAEIRQTLAELRAGTFARD